MARSVQGHFLDVGQMTETCVLCGKGQAEQVVQPYSNTVLIRGVGVRMSISFQDDCFMRCLECGGEYYTGEQADEHQKKVDWAKHVVLVKKKLSDVLLAIRDVNCVGVGDGGLWIYAKKDSKRMRKEIAKVFEEYLDIPYKISIIGKIVAQ